MKNNQFMFMREVKQGQEAVKALKVDLDNT